MRPDVLVIGSGLAGCTAALKVLEAGWSCQLISSGQSALHFSSGSLDFLGSLPDGSCVSKPLEALETLSDQLPAHPYALMGAKKCGVFAGEAERCLQRWGIPMTGSVHDGNHDRATPLGLMARTWLSSVDVLLGSALQALPQKQVLLANIEGFLDFFPEILAENLKAYGVGATLHTVSLDVLEQSRRNPSEFRSINIARLLDQPLNLQVLARDLSGPASAVGAVVLPACLGLESLCVLEDLKASLGKPVFLVPTLPPSLIGTRINRTLLRRFSDLGGVFMPGDQVCGARISQGQVTEVHTRHHGDIPLKPRHVLLASGNFFSRGLESTQTGIREAIFDLDMRDVPPNRDDWTSTNVFDPQPYTTFGVRVDETMRPFLKGERLENMCVAGMVLGGFDAVRLGCGAGVALTTACAAVNTFLEKV